MMTEIYTIEGGPKEVFSLEVTTLKTLFDNCINKKLEVSMLAFSLEDLGLRQVMKDFFWGFEFSYGYLVTYICDGTSHRKCKSN